jgi:hypothetical protein
MLESLLLVAAFTVAPAPDCAAQAGWNAGREGQVAAAACSDEDYREAHRLGEALHQLKQEHAEIESRIATLAEADRGAQRRRQRQITIDLEAIRGVATTRGWPLDIAPEITP